jgi:polysaccharide biosynthesis/export protein
VPLLPACKRGQVVRSVLSLAPLIGLVSWSGCYHESRSRVSIATSQPHATLAGTPFDPQSPRSYVLYPGDLLMIRYPTDATLDQQVRIRSDGMISLAYVGEVQAAYRRPADLAADLNKSYEGVLKKANVTVIVMEESGRKVFVGGQIRVPGALGLRPNQTLTQAIFETGGITPQACKEQILVMRARPNDATYVLKADLDKILAGKEPDVILEPCDIIHVPETAITKADLVVEQYVNLIIPRNAIFTFATELNKQPVRVLTNGQASIPPVTITR